MNLNSFSLIAICLALTTAASAQTLIEGKNPAGSAVTQNPVTVGGKDSNGNSVALKLALDGSLTGVGDASAANQTNGAQKTKVVNTAGTEVYTATTVKSTAKEASHILKGSAGSLVSVGGSSDTDQWILIMDSATVPTNGAVTLLYPPIHVAASGNFHLNFTTPLVAANGITICNSNANSFTKTLGGADCIFTSQVQ